MNPRLVTSHFTQEERQIIHNLGHEWYVTHGGTEFTLGKTSKYRYFVMRPTNLYTDMFNLQKEVVVLFSPYDTFDTRSLDGIEYAIRQYPPLRVDRICSVIISKDPLIENVIANIVSSYPESPVVVPFTYAELVNLNKQDPYFVRNRFKSHFYTRDLFAFEAPLRKDLYFFGRNDLIQQIVNRHKSNENSGLFGLRKTGKTSIIFGVERMLARLGEHSVFIDCQNPAFHRRRWNKALFYIIEEIKNQRSLNIETRTEDEYTEENASVVFEADLLRINKKLNRKSILLIFDEIENVTFSISPSEHWEKGLDFVFFWQTLRSIFQKLDSVFSYLIVGTNPSCIENANILGKDNPIFNQVPFEYVPGFDVPQTREMVRKIGRIMGLKFDEIVYGKLTEDFGGHPFLIRHVCSVINHITPPTRPTEINKIVYEQAKSIFIREYAAYIEMILDVLSRFYSDEYEMLSYLACGDMESFTEVAQLSPLFTNHLLGYGIINKHNESYAFGIECVHQYLEEKQKYKKLNLSQSEMWAEISERRNEIEPKLRQIIRMQLIACCGKSEARKVILTVMGGSRKKQYDSFSYLELFDSDKAKFYFDDLRKIIGRYWNHFKHIFGDDVDEFNDRMKTINRYRVDAHAKSLDMEKMTHFRVSISALESQIRDFLG